MSHIDDVIDMSMSTSATIPMAVTIGGGIANLGHVIAKTFFSDESFSGSLIWTPNYEHSL